MEFKSGVSGRFKGFRIDILCAPVSSENVDGGQMKKRDVISFYENNNKTSRGERKMDMNCTKVPVSSPPPTPPHKVRIHKGISARGVREGGRRG